MYYFIFIALITVHSVHAGFEFIILHNNDMNSRLEESYEENKYVGGIERVSYVVKEARKEAAAKKTPPVIYLNAGDVYTDVVWRHPFSRKVAIELLNNLMPDAA
ncbi:hypothetical protein QE152_g3712 [Popillia japonica]|uniref:5'-nucleotidase n=1 Tax=Popillia japonica TaxID=7064 RepID=A0AAW1N001_POPJA